MMKISVSEFNSEWESASLDGAVVHFSVNLKNIDVMEMSSRSPRQGNGRRLLAMLKNTYNIVCTSCVTEDSPEAIAFWQAMLDEGIVKSARLTNGTQLVRNNIVPWFEPGFDEAIRAFINNHWPEDATMICHDEARRWAKILLESDLQCEVALCDGMYTLHSHANRDYCHSWLTINGKIFDPTAAQFKEEPSTSCYWDHDCFVGADLNANLNFWLNDPSSPRELQLNDAKKTKKKITKP